mgnify:FL=1
MKIVDSIWFTPMVGGTIGIVRVVDDVGNAKYYIGIADGRHQGADEELIAKLGAKFPLQVGNQLFGVE